MAGFSLKTNKAPVATSREKKIVSPGGHISARRFGNQALAKALAKAVARALAQAPPKASASALPNGLAEGPASAQRWAALATKTSLGPQALVGGKGARGQPKGRLKITRKNARRTAQEPPGNTKGALRSLEFL